MGTQEITQVTRNPKFPQFDVVSDASDHHYFSKPTIPNSSAQKKIMQEWKLLSKDLRETIYVRVYETRTDLLRAAIVGARGTPYHDGLFFFDISFPSDYPARPPKVYYWSFGFRINPILFWSGRVCLSLLRMGILGKTCEKWDPNNSTIFQVLLSIQALVLNETPYFNDPGYGPLAGKRHWENKKSLAYSEDVFVLSCKQMLLVLRRPPMNFEPLVKEHFMDRAGFILNACDMYRKGLVKVGMFNGVVKGGGKGVVSIKFKSSIDKLFRDLVEAFLRNGAPVEHFIELVTKNENDSKQKTDVKKKEKVSLVNKLRYIVAGLMKVKKKYKTSPVLDVTQNLEVVRKCN